MNCKSKKMSGKIVKGIQKGSYFTSLDWVQEQCMIKLGFRPHPGTLNLQIEADCLQIIDQLKNEPCEELIPPDPKFCKAKVYPVVIGKEKCALLIPDESVRVHGAAIVEFIAPKSLKDALNVDDGDSLTVVIGD
jgi:riboflavin kinase, archaea type